MAKAVLRKATVKTEKAPVRRTSRKTTVQPQSHAAQEIAQSKLTSQGQISVPLAVRDKLGVGPGSTLEWIAEGGNIVVKKVRKHSFEDLRELLKPLARPDGPSIDAKKAIAKYIRMQHARGRY